MIAGHPQRRFLAVVVAGLACACGSSDSPTTPTKANAPPGNVTVTFSPDGYALVGAATTFSAKATDPDGDALSYAWNFGDGGTGAGATTTHAYTNSDVYTVTVTVTDGKGGSSAATTAIRSRSLGGNWIELADFPRYGYQILQTGINLSGSRIDRLHRPGTVDPGILTGTIFDARQVRFQVYYPQTNETDTITGTLDPGISVINFTIQPGGGSSMLIRE